MKLFFCGESQRRVDNDSLSSSGGGKCCQSNRACALPSKLHLPISADNSRSASVRRVNRTQHRLYREYSAESITSYGEKNVQMTACSRKEREGRVLLHSSRKI